MSPAETPDPLPPPKASLPDLPDPGPDEPEGEFHSQDLIDELKETAEKLAKDQATRGDLKILSRTLRELRYGFKVFKRYRTERKVTVFGSARTPSDHPAYQQTVDFARKIAAHGWMVLTGAGGGIMEAGHVGAGIALSMGVNIMLPFEQSANDIITGDDKLIHLKYFFTRKLLFVKEVHAIALFPGGFGTMDEAFETLTLVQTGKHELMPIVCVDETGGTYWKAWEEFIHAQLLNRGLISPEDLSLFKVTDNPDVALAEIMRFYSVYNSMRYVRKLLVFRLHREPTAALMKRLNNEFADILESGEIEQVPAFEVEADDPHVQDLFRIAFHFNRRNIGRLRQMVDVINQELGDDV